MTGTTAFDFLRQFTDVDEPTERLVLKQTRGQITDVELAKAFEKGIGGEYGKMYKADPQTLLGWIRQFQNTKGNAKNYLETGLLDPLTHITSPNYPVGLDSWHKEANKCYTAFLNGVSETYFHPHVYDRMMLDGKIQVDAFRKYVPKDAVLDENFNATPYQQKVLRDVFLTYKSNGWNQVYFIK